MMEGAVACTITKYDIIVRKSFLQFAFGTDNLKMEQETLNSASEFDYEFDYLSIYADFFPISALMLL